MSSTPGIQYPEHAAGATGKYGPDETFSEPPPGANYKKSISPVRRCDTCLHMLASVCHLWGSYVEDDYVCADWKFDIIEEGTSEDYMSLAEIFFSSPIVEQDDDGLIWKEALRTGTYPLSPGPNGQAVNKPIIVKLQADDPMKEVGLNNLVEAFNDRAFEHVTVPLSHKDQVHENTGFIDKLKIVPDKNDPSRHVLLAGYRFTEPEIKGKVERGTIPNNSVGILFNYTRKSDGRTFPQALAHIALTHRPFIRGLKPFGINASDEEVENMLVFDGTGVWDEAKTHEHRRDMIWRALQKVNDEIRSGIGQDDQADGMAFAPYYTLTSMTDNKLLISHTGYDTDDAYVANYNVGDDSVDLEPLTKWQKVERQWVKAAIQEDGDFAAAEHDWDDLILYFDAGTTDAPLGTPGGKQNWVDKVGGLPRYVRKIARELMKRHGYTMSRAIATAISRIKHWAVVSKDPKVKAKAVKAIAEWEAKKAKAHLKSMSDDDFVEKYLFTDWIPEIDEPRKGVETVMAKETGEVQEAATTEEKTTEATVVDFDMQQVKDLESRLALAETQLAEANKKAREYEVDRKIDSYKETWGEQPALLKKIKTIMLADTGSTYSLMLSDEEGATASSYTLTGIVEEILSVLPKPEVKLTDQASRTMGFDEHPSTRSDDKTSTEDKALKLAEWMNDDEYISFVKKRGNGTTS
jgi:hypothetical protein